MERPMVLSATAFSIGFSEAATGAALGNRQHRADCQMVFPSAAGVVAGAVTGGVVLAGGVAGGVVPTAGVAGPG